MKIVERKAEHDEKLEKLKVRLSNPLSLCWQISKHCNYHCPFCLSGEQNTNDLPLEDMMKIIDILSERNVIRIDFTGGEPLLRPDVCEIIEYASAKGIETLVTTNGSIYSEKIANTLLNTNSLLLISLDGNKEVHDRSRGDGAFEKAVSSIKKYRDFGIPIRVNYLIRKDNLDQIEYIYELVRSLNVPRLFYIFIAPQGRAYQDQSLLLSKEEHETYFKLIQNMKRKSEDFPFITIQDYSKIGNYHSCFLINSEGNAVSQGYSDNECVVVGNILSDGLDKCWNNPIVDHKRHFLQYAYMFEYYM